VRRVAFIRCLALMLLGGASLCQAGSYDEFFRAIKQDDAGTVRQLLARGFDGNTTNPAGEHGLLLAVREPSLKVLSVLIDWPKISVEARSAKDESPLMLAALQGLTEVCQQLIAKDADVNKPGWAPLHYAATHGHLAVMSLLLEHHAYIDAGSPNGTTPLMMAAGYGTPAAVTLLVEAGADPVLKNDQGFSALDFAERANQRDSVKILFAAIRARQPKGTW
jgi:ankyrin repeat protein